MKIITWLFLMIIPLLLELMGLYLSSIPYLVAAVVFVSFIILADCVIETNEQNEN